MYQLIMQCDMHSSMWTEPNRVVGDVVWVKTLDAARHLVEGGFARWPAGMAMEVQADAGPTETKKLFGDRTDGPSTVSPSSSRDGQERLSSASAAGLVLPHRV